MRFNDAVIGVLLVIVSQAIYFYARTLPDIPGQDYGAAVFPIILACGLGLCGAALTVSGARNWQGAIAFAPWTRDPTPWIRSAAMLAAILFYIFAAEPLGFMITSTVTLFALFVLLGSRWWVAVIVAVAVSLLIERSFGDLLLVPLPRGLFWL
jgi:putative tricarboxylic transport membrane protein